MDIETFKLEMIESQKKGELTNYCLDNWEQALKLIGGSNEMDKIIEEATLKAEELKALKGGDNG